MLIVKGRACLVRSATGYVGHIPLYEQEDADIARVMLKSSLPFLARREHGQSGEAQIHRCGPFS